MICDKIVLDDNFCFVTKEKAEDDFNKIIFSNLCLVKKISICLNSKPLNKSQE